MAELNPADAPSWMDFVTNFDATKKAFDDNYTALLQIGPQIDRYPGLRPQWEKLVTDGTDHYNTLQKLQTTRDYAASWLNWLSSGARGVFSFLGFNAYGPDGLGLAPVAIALYSAGAAIIALEAIKYWMADSYAMAQRLKQQMAIADQIRADNPNMSVDEAYQRAAAHVNSVLGPPSKGIFGELSNLATLLIIGGALFLFGPPLLRAIDARRR